MDTLLPVTKLFGILATGHSMDKPDRLIGYLFVIFSLSDFYQNDLSHENLGFVFHRTVLQFLRPAEALFR